MPFENIPEVIDKTDFKLKIINLEEVSRHQSIDDCWIVVFDRVYDVTNFLKEHPGGEDLILEHAGKDATVAFRGASHTSLAINYLKKLFIGELPEEQKLFRKFGGYRLSDMPE